MTKSEIQGSATLKLMMLVFGKKPSDQSLSDFSAEIGPLKQDAAFIEDVRQYALKNCASD